VYEEIASSRAVDLRRVVDARLLRVRALTQCGDIAGAIGTLRSLCAGEALPFEPNPEGVPSAAEEGAEPAAGPAEPASGDADAGAAVGASGKGSKKGGKAEKGGKADKGGSAPASDADAAWQGDFEAPGADPIGEAAAFGFANHAPAGAPCNVRALRAAAGAALRAVRLAAGAGDAELGRERLWRGIPAIHPHLLSSDEAARAEAEARLAAEEGDEPDADEQEAAAMEASLVNLSGVGGGVPGALSAGEARRGAACMAQTDAALRLRLLQAVAELVLRVFSVVGMHTGAVHGSVWTLFDSPILDRDAGDPGHADLAPEPAATARARIWAAHAWRGPLWRAAAATLRAARSQLAELHASSPAPPPATAGRPTLEALLAAGPAAAPPKTGLPAACARSTDLCARRAGAAWFRRLVGHCWLAQASLEADLWCCAPTPRPRRSAAILAASLAASQDLLRPSTGPDGSVDGGASSIVASSVAPDSSPAAVVPRLSQLEPGAMHCLCAFDERELTICMRGSLAAALAASGCLESAASALESAMRSAQSAGAAVLGQRMLVARAMVAARAGDRDACGAMLRVVAGSRVDPLAEAPAQAHALLWLATEGGGAAAAPVDGEPVQDMPEGASIRREAQASGAGASLEDRLALAGKAEAMLRLWCQRFGWRVALADGSAPIPFTPGRAEHAPESDFGLGRMGSALCPPLLPHAAGADSLYIPAVAMLAEARVVRAELLLRCPPAPAPLSACGGISQSGLYAPLAPAAHAEPSAVVRIDASAAVGGETLTLAVRSGRSSTTTTSTAASALVADGWAASALVAGRRAIGALHRSACASPAVLGRALLAVGRASVRLHECGALTRGGIGRRLASAAFASAAVTGRDGGPTTWAVWHSGLTEAAISACQELPGTGSEGSADSVPRGLAAARAVWAAAWVSELRARMETAPGAVLAIPTEEEAAVAAASGDGDGSGDALYGAAPSGAGGTRWQRSPLSPAGATDPRDVGAGSTVGLLEEAMAGARETALLRRLQAEAAAAGPDATAASLAPSADALSVPAARVMAMTAQRSAKEWIVSCGSLEGGSLLLSDSGSLAPCGAAVALAAARAASHRWLATPTGTPSAEALAESSWRAYAETVADGIPALAGPAMSRHGVLHESSDEAAGLLVSTASGSPAVPAH
jgi:hypothetical protein